MQLVRALITAIGVIAICAGVSAQQVQSTFTTGSEGWAGARIWNIGPGEAINLEPVAVSWEPWYGKPGGGIRLNEYAGSNDVFVAPRAFLGNKAAAFGTDLVFDLITSRGTQSGEKELFVALVGAGRVLSYRSLVSTAWTRYSVPLSGAGWEHCDWSVPTPWPAATDQDMQAVLGDLSALYIWGDFTGESDESSRLDNVTLSSAQPPPGWSQQPVVAPDPRWGHAMVYDSAREAMVLFGGSLDKGLCQGSLLNDTHEWNGTVWTPRTHVNSPMARDAHGMAYDGHRGVTVVFGGNRECDLYLNDTWEWDGANWVEKKPAAKPSPRWYPAMAYDSARGVTVLFGGIDCSAGTCQTLSDTWEWDGINWTRKNPPTSPSSRMTALAYDSVRQVVVMFGGAWQSATAGNDLNDTWEYDGTDWTLRTPATLPPIREQHTLAYDSRRGVVVLFGGLRYEIGGRQNLNDTWEWNGIDWHPQASAVVPWTRRSHAMAYDEARRQTVMFGGLCTTVPELPEAAINDTWFWSGPLAPADFDMNGRVDQGDLFLFEACATGPGVAYDLQDLPADCNFVRVSQGRIAPDRDADGDVDQEDFGLWQRCYSGPDKPANPYCP